MGGNEDTDLSYGVAALGNPGPLGLGSFALTTMALSIYNVEILTDTSEMVVALALFYGGIAQFIAGECTIMVKVYFLRE